MKGSRRAVIAAAAMMSGGLAARALADRATSRVAAQQRVATATVAAESDELYYEVRGTGPPLLMIPGGVVDAGIYAPAADLLAEDHTVLTYDRRGTSRSSRNDPQNFDIGQQARDAVAVLNSEGFASARIFGSSGGAVIALEMAKSQPQAIDALVAHEPPVARLLPDAEQRLTEGAEIYLAAWEEGPERAIFLFLESVQFPESVAGPESEEEMARAGANIDHFLKYEMLPFTNYVPDVEVIKAHDVRIAMGVGELSLDRSYGQTVPILAEQLDCPMVVFPGHHTSYQDMAEAWVAVLCDAFNQIDAGAD